MVSINNEMNVDNKREPNLPQVHPVQQMVSPVIPDTLQHEKMYSIQIGDHTFKLSGASLSYDSPSYFTDYFLANPTATVVYIDRSPKVFEKIYAHLQGYSIKIEDDFEFFYLLLDANYFRLKRLKSRIISEGLIINIGGKIFNLPKEIMSSKGNYPNFFSVIYNSMLLDPYAKNKLFIRPPPITPYVCNRSSVIFEDILYALYGNTVEIKSEEHRKNLINECKYYQFFGLEQKFINCKILENPFSSNEEILINYEDIKKDGLLNDTLDSMIGQNNAFTVVKYSRPYVDTGVYRDLVLQIKSTDVNLMVNPSLNFVNLLIYNKTAIKLKDILAKITDDYIYEKRDNSQTLTVLIQMNDSVGFLNSLKMEHGWLNTLINVNKEDKSFDDNKVISIKLLKSQWTINVQGRSKIWMNCLKFDGVLDKSHFNKRREFI